MERKKGVKDILGMVFMVLEKILQKFLPFRRHRRRRRRVFIHQTKARVDVFSR